MGAVRSATVVSRHDSKAESKADSKAGRRVSMGYGFVEFRTAADAQRALREMGGTRLDDHVLQLKLSERSAAPAQPSPDKARKRASAGGGEVVGTPGPKLMVRNLPFQASKKEVRELFAAFGELKDLRLPKKFDGTHRGFAFVEFASKGEAAKALAALRATHLYGRHRVLQYAEEEHSVDAMRQKLRAQLDDERGEAQQAEARRRKRKAAGGVDELGGGIDL